MTEPIETAKRLIKQIEASKTESDQQDSRKITKDGINDASSITIDTISSGTQLIFSRQHL